MRIHSDILVRGDLFRVMAGPKFTDVELYVTGEFGSRSHARALEVALRGTGTRHKRPPNTGILGAGSGEKAATFDDWGWFISALYVIDPKAKIGSYKNRADFASRTSNKYHTERAFS